MNKLIELDELKLELKKTQELYLEALNRIDKAIEYIKNKQEDINNGGNDMSYRQLTHLLEILGGTNEHRNRQRKNNI